MGFEGFPFIIGWELTLACNLSCQHCGSSAGKPRAGELTLDESLAICDQFPGLLVKEVDFTGGEPLLNPNWHKLAFHLRDLGITTRIISNGLDLKNDDVDLMREAGVAGVGFSIDGLEDCHDLTRGRKGLFRRTTDSIRMIAAARIPVTVITTANRINLDQMQELYGMLVKEGVSRWQVQPVTRLGRVLKFSSLELSEEHYMRLGGLVKELESRSREDGMEVLIADSLGYYTGLDPRYEPWGGCPAGLVSCGITSDGKVKGCLSLPDGLVEGDLRENDLWDIWFHPDAFAYTRRFTVENMGDNCKGCGKAEECRGGCSAVSYGRTGRFHNDPYCFFGINNRTSSLAGQGNKALQG